MSVAFSLDQRANRTTDTHKHIGGSGGDAACFFLLNPASTSLKSKQQANAKKFLVNSQGIYCMQICKIQPNTQAFDCK